MNAAACMDCYCRHAMVVAVPHAAIVSIVVAFPCMQNPTTAFCCYMYCYDCIALFY